MKTPRVIRAEDQEQDFEWDLEFQPEKEIPFDRKSMTAYDAAARDAEGMSFGYWSEHWQMTSMGLEAA